MRLISVSSLAAISALALSSPPALAGDKGGKAFNAGDYATTVSEWTSAVRHGDARAPYNLGVLYENGLASLPRDLNQAMSLYLLGAQRGDLPSMVAIGRTQIATGQTAAGLSWLNLAARWNDPDAIGMLRQMQQSVPDPDLFIAKQHADDEAAAALGYSLGCMLAGGCNNRAVVPSMRPSAPPHQTTTQAPPIVQSENQVKAFTNSLPIRPTASASAANQAPHMCADGAYVVGTCTMAPDGTYVGGQPRMAPDGTYVGGQQRMAPDGSYVTGPPRMAPDGTYVGGNGKVIMCPDGSYVAGKTCRLMPNGQYVGQ